MEKIKFRFEILKFKITLFTTIMGGGIYLYLNKSNFLKDLDTKLFFASIVVMIIYGYIGFMLNLMKINKIERSTDDI